MKKCAFLCFLCLLSSPVWAWNAEGHRVIADIAYQKLSPSARQRINRLTKIQDKKMSAKKRFLMLSVLPDQLRFIHMNAFNSWHYIRLSDPLWANKPQVVWAIEHSKQMLKTSHSEAEKILWLSFLMHFVGDIHQPLHCSNRQDFGGNSVIIHSQLAQNLHQYWDRGLGLLMHHHELVNVLSEQHFPSARINQPTLVWAHESAQLAEKFAYSLPDSKYLSDAYNLKGQALVKVQLSLAGQRLAYLLNQIF